ncbi:MAG: hypothetical protein ACRD1C_11660 [Terriglobales bacterium]
MNISSITTQSSPVAESAETIAQTRQEAQQGDQQAIQKLAAMTSSQAQPTAAPKSSGLLNVKA